MNLRQKYKKAKRELERCKYDAARQGIDEKNFRILSPRCYIEVGPDVDITEDELRERVMKQLSVCVKHYIQITKEEIPNGNTIYCGKLKIVDGEGEK